MARRLIDPGILQNEKFGMLPPMARLLLMGLVISADDQGRGKAHPALLRSLIFPYDDVLLTDIADWLALVETNGTIRLYTIGEKEYYQLLNWWQYQAHQYARPSEFPRAPGWHDRVRYTLTKGVIVTCNWTLNSGQLTTNTCDEDGNPLGGRSYTPPLPMPEATPEASPATPIETPVPPPLAAPAESESPATAERTEVDWTRAIVEKMESVGIGVTPYTVDNYVAACQDHGIHAVLSGITAAAENNKQHRMSYVLACIRNKAAGTAPNRNGKYPQSGSGRVSNKDADDESQRAEAMYGPRKKITKEQVDAAMWRPG